MNKMILTHRTFRLSRMATLADLRKIDARDNLAAQLMLLPRYKQN